MNLIKEEKIILGLKILILISIFFLVFIIYCRQIELTSLDIGRHLKNGELIWHNWELLFSNFYSFTEKEFTFINHHWLSGVIYWWLYNFGGFKLLTVFNIFIGLFTISIIFICSIKRSNFWLSSIFILPAILLLSERTDIRPEMFSYLFVVIYIYLLNRFKQSEDTNGWYIILIIQLLWVNMHIYFFIGLLIINSFLFEQVILKNRNFFKFKFCRRLFYLTIACFSVSLLNPNFIKGLIYPLNILKKYGYEIVENKSPFYLQYLMINYNILIFKIFLIILILSFIALLILKRKVIIFDIVLALFFTLVSFLAIRNLSLFGLVTFPIITYNFYHSGLFKKKKLNVLTFMKPDFFDRNKKPIEQPVSQSLRLSMILLISTIAIYSAVFIWLAYDYFGQRKYLKNDFGLGLAGGVSDSITFYKRNNLAGPIFNNYDLGSALIFWLFPGEKVFVDNRPEAYSQEFFSQVYIPMMQDQEKWKEYSQKYKINLIYFSYTDGTPWAREFLFARLADEEWPLIYFDKYVVIMAKNNENNSSLIKQFKFDDSEFKKRLSELRENSNKYNLLNLASLAELAGKEDLAMSVYEQRLQNQPYDGQVLTALGYLLSRNGKPADSLKALNYFYKALESGIKLPAVYNQMGLLYWTLSDTSQARKMWQKALGIDRNNEHAKSYLNQLESLKPLY